MRPKADLSRSDKDPAAVAAIKNLKNMVETEIQQYRGGSSDARPRRPPHTSDFARLARRICGKSIGVVLGGGGARGIAHLVRRDVCHLCLLVLTSSRDFYEQWRNTGSQLTK